MFDTKKIRAMLWWGVPLYVGLSAMSFWMVPHLIGSAIEGIATQAPAVRITPGALLFPFVGIFTALGLVIAVLRAIPFNGRPVQIMEKIFNLTVLASAIVLALIVTTSTLIQSHYMPKLGYSRCGLLQGNPTVWFTDWVKDQGHCVRGKTVDWVNEQPRSTPGKL